jgi:hypothetical protein
MTRRTESDGPAALQRQQKGVWAFTAISPNAVGLLPATDGLSEPLMAILSGPKPPKPDAILSGTTRGASSAEPLGQPFFVNELSPRYSYGKKRFSRRR